MFEKLTDHLKLREKSLDAAWVRNEVIAQNIANVDTPGYKRKSVAFEQYLNEAIDKGGFKGNTTDSRHIQIGAGSADNVSVRVTSDYSNLSTRLDGNNVDIEKEMADSAKNDIRYNTLVQSVSDSYKRLMSAITEGRR
ncbi:MAG TPA: flagellar basal body rod protein FlgB [Clostridia bacterium]|nr:flagellar basal body rod protein FlgB [Clostridia bacterium]